MIYLVDVIYKPDLDAPTWACPQHLIANEVIKNGQIIEVVSHNSNTSETITDTTYLNINELQSVRIREYTNEQWAECVRARDKAVKDFLKGGRKDD